MQIFSDKIQKPRNRKPRNGKPRNGKPRKTREYCMKYQIILLLIISVGLIIALFCFVLETVYNFIRRKISDGKMNFIL